MTAGYTLRETRGLSDGLVLGYALKPEGTGQRGWISPIGPKPSCGVSM
jgi:hypothetical protein